MAGNEIIENNNIDMLYDNKYVALSNALIQAREKTSLLESKIELLAIYRLINEMNTREREDSEGKIYSVHSVTINSSEIRQLICRKGGSLYGQIEAAAYELKQKMYYYRDPGNNRFTMASLYGTVEYMDGKLTIDFNPDTEHLFLELKDNFTKLRLDIAFKFQTNGGFQLYKLLKSYAYSLPGIDENLPQEQQETIAKQYSLSELRLQLGYVDLNQPEVKKEVSKKNPDAEKISSLEKKPKYKRWVDFYNRVIEPGLKEVNQISDIYISSIDKICGAHGRVDGVIIKIQNNKKYYLDHSQEKKNKKDQIIKEKIFTVKSEDEIDDFIDELRDLFDEKLKTKELKSIAEAAEYNIEDIKKIYDIAQNTTSSIENLTGFMIAGLKNGYENSKISKTSKGKNKFDNFDNRDVDYNELAKVIMEMQD